MLSLVRFQTIFPVILYSIIYYATTEEYGDRPLITVHNREVGNKWLYLQMQFTGESGIPSKYYGSTTVANTISTMKVTPVINIVPTTTKAKTTMATTTSTTTKPPVKMPERPVLPAQSIIRLPNDANNCGMAKAKPLFIPSGYVIGGEDSYPGEFPWYAAITLYKPKEKPQWKVICGASLINSRYAITAAHCLHGRHKETLEIVFNLRDTANISHSESQGEVRRKVARVFIHPQYNSQTQHDDIALIQFKDPIDFRRSERFLAPICLPESVGNTYASKNGTVIGFGHTAYGVGRPKENARHLMKVHVPILSHAQCLKSKVPTKKNITENMLCAGDHGKDACINDSGGPLMVYEKGRSVLVGLASWGIGCALQDFPGVYTRVSKYLSWIKTTSSK